MKQKLLICGAAAFAALFLFSGIMLGRQLADQKQSTEAYGKAGSRRESRPQRESGLQPGL